MEQLTFISILLWIFSINLFFYLGIIAYQNRQEAWLGIMIIFSIVIVGLVSYYFLIKYKVSQ